ncbi:MAG: DNA alkylation repair protein [bacterium]|nr:DNA alkylation repair protein [bacterium]
MTLQEAMATLEEMGTEQNRKVYGRHGVGSPMFGVSYANLEKVRKQAQVDYVLAQDLWASGNHDARVLATMVTDPEAMQASEIDAWMKDLDNSVLTGAFTKLVYRTPFAQRRMEKWISAKGEWAGQAGWGLLARFAMDLKNDLSDSFFELYIEKIAQEIHGQKNMVRDAMNSALIAIGIRNAYLEKRAMAAAKRIGKVEVDHGETGCKTPDAGEYIQRTVARKEVRMKS